MCSQEQLSGVPAGMGLLQNWGGVRGLQNKKKKPKTKSQTLKLVTGGVQSTATPDFLCCRHDVFTSVSHSCCVGRRIKGKLGENGGSQLGLECSSLVCAGLGLTVVLGSLWPLFPWRGGCWRSWIAAAQKPFQVVSGSLCLYGDLMAQSAVMLGVKEQRDGCTLQQNHLWLCLDQRWSSFLLTWPHPAPQLTVLCSYNASYKLPVTSRSTQWVGYDCLMAAFESFPFYALMSSMLV